MSFRRPNVRNSRAVVVKYSVLCAVYLCLAVYINERVIWLCFIFMLMIGYFKKWSQPRFCLPCLISISFTLLLVMVHFTFILVQLMFCSLQYHDKNDISLIYFFWGGRAAFLARADGLREEINGVLERKKELRQ